MTCGGTTSSTAQPETHEPEPIDAEHPLFVLYTSGTTGKPKGILHTTGGYLTQASFTHREVFDLKPETDVFWCAADIGWVTGHSYIVYGPLSNGATPVMYEGTPDTPHQDRWWEIVEKYRVTILYTAPTTIRTFMKWGERLPADYDLTSLRLLGSVGEPINPEAWIWYRRDIGGDRTPDRRHVVADRDRRDHDQPAARRDGDQARVGDAPAARHRGRRRRRRGAVGAGRWRRLPRADRAVAGMLRSIWGDPDRYVETYWSRFPGRYFAGDGAKKDEDGDLWLLGRVDDVMLVSGHNISTTEVESALVSHPSVAEAAVVGATDPVTGQGIVAFVIVRARSPRRAPEEAEAFVTELRNHVAHEIGAIAKPRQIMVVAELPEDPLRQDHAPAAARRGRAPRARRRDDAGRPDRDGPHRPRTGRPAPPTSDLV